MDSHAEGKAQPFCMRRGISGLRVGWMHTLNADLIGAMDSLAYFAMPSTIIQEAATQMLLDKAFVKSYLKENQRRLALIRCPHRYEECHSYAMHSHSRNAA